MILNQFTLEYLLFPESAVMCLAVLLIVLAVKIMIQDTKKKYIKIFILLLLAGISYQGTISIFPVLAILICIIRQMVEKREYKIAEKENFLEIFKIILITISVLILVFGIVEVCKNLLNSEQNRNLKVETIEDFEERIIITLGYFDEIWNKTMYMIPEGLNNIVIIMTVVLLVGMKVKKEIIMQYLVFMLIIALSCIIPMFLFDTGPCGRVNNPAAMVLGISLLILLTKVWKCKSERIINIMYVFIIIVFSVNSIYLIRNTTEHIAANRVENNNGKTIKAMVDEYEKSTGNKITKLGYRRDLYPNYYSIGIKKIGSLTERKFACNWSATEIVEFYLERDLELVPYSIELFKENFHKNYDEFREEQITFKENTMYMVIY